MNKVMRELRDDELKSFKKQVCNTIYSRLAQWRIRRKSLYFRGYIWWRNGFNYIYNFKL